MVCGMNDEVTFWPFGRSVKVRRGTTLLEAARRANVQIRTRCGGKAACFMCKVTIRPGSELMPMSDNERRKLAGLEQEGVRLSCQARTAGSVHADVPLDPLRSAVDRLLARQAEDENELW